MTASRIAFLIPAYNSGALLADTVESVVASGLGPKDCAIIVSDNASTDGSIEALPRRLLEVVPVAVRRNAVNIGRIANWNAALAAAEAAGFSYAMFLMAGDRLAGDAVLALRERMERQDAILGTAPYIVTDVANRPQRMARRIRWCGETALDHRSFVSQSLALGFLLHGPLGANLYRIDGTARLRFDPADESHTDQIATAAFLREAEGRVCYLDMPVSYWRCRPGRFHNSMSVEQRLEGDMRTIRHACKAAAVAPDYSRIRASLFVRGTVLRRGGVAAAWRNACALTQGVPMSWRWLMQMLLSRLRHGTPWVVRA